MATLHADTDAGVNSKAEGSESIEHVSPQPNDTANSSSVDETKADIEGTREERVTIKAWMSVFVRRPLYFPRKHCS